MIWRSRIIGSGVSTLGIAIPHEAPVARQVASPTPHRQTQPDDGPSGPTPATHPVGRWRATTHRAAPIKTSDSQR